MRSGSGGAESQRDLPRELVPNHAEFEDALDRADLPALRPPRARELLTRFGRWVYEQSESQSLIARGDRPVLFTRHVLDSLNLLGAFPESPLSLLDVGSGAGFPGIPMAIVWPETRVVLVESRERKAGFLERVVRQLGLPNVDVLCARLEDLPVPGSGDAGGFACVVVRGVGNLRRVVADAARVASAGGCWAYFLGADSDGPALVRSLATSDYPARITLGAFGGRLLVGRFP